MSTLFNKGNKPDGNCSSTVQRESEMSAFPSAVLAERLASRNYNWDYLADLLVARSSPEELAESMRIIQFEYSNLLIQHSEDSSIPIMQALSNLQHLHEVLLKMYTSEPGTLTLALVADHKPQS